MRRLDYTEDTLLDRLGDEAYSSEPQHVLVHERLLGATKLDTAIRLLFLQRPVRRDDARRALGDAGVEALGTLRLARVAASVTPRGKLAPVREVLVASDGFSHGADDPPDYVATYSPASRLCDMFTPRPRVRRALDVGTGDGVLALLAAQHSRRVVATDVNPRALAFTQLNAALNGLDNIEVHSGSLYEPAGDEPRDLIVCNAPFVVSPDTNWQYRDTQLPEDMVSEHVVRGAIERLAPGGWAALGVSWLGRKASAPHERPLGWLAGSGCDAWILPVFNSEPYGTPPRGATISAATSSRRRWAAGPPTSTSSACARSSKGRSSCTAGTEAADVRIDDADADELEAADAQIRRAFSARDFDDDRCSRRASPAADARAAATAKGLAAAWISLNEGTQPRRRPPAGSRQEPRRRQADAATRPAGAARACGARLSPPRGA